MKFVHTPGRSLSLQFLKTGHEPLGSRNRNSLWKFSSTRVPIYADLEEAEEARMVSFTNSGSDLRNVWARKFPQYSTFRQVMRMAIFGQGFPETNPGGIYDR